MSRSADNDNDDGKPAGPGKVPRREDLAPQLPRRFYENVTVEPREGGFAVLLDGRPVRTPGKHHLQVPTAALAEAIAAEWRAQGEHIDPATMHLTRLANTAIDAVSGRMGEVADDIVAFAGSDLLCYRAESPRDLVHRQAAAWDPVLRWVGEHLGCNFEIVEGIMPVSQSPETLEAVAAVVAPLDPFRLSAVHVMTTLTGSAVLALARLMGRLSADQTWAAAHVDEDWQVAHWGEDAEAAERRKRRHAEFSSASGLLDLLGTWKAPAP
jgi:chaperone required for assembly of F1-ATPase